jgi:hypothetical protein
LRSSALTTVASIFGEARTWSCLSRYDTWLYRLIKYKNVTSLSFLFPTTDVTESTYWHYGTFSQLVILYIR